jgi:SAM-dependent methyltransferase/uncharacterized protein YbaR (Trm112 family)
MYAEAIPYLRCPACGARLRPEGAERDDSGELTAGALSCERCGRGYPIREGVADFLGAPAPPTLTQLTNEWRATAWVYERAWRPFALTLLSREPFPYRRELPLVASMAKPERGGLFVDVACSNGLYARAMVRAARAHHGAALQVIGVDHSLPMLLEARRRAREAGLPISYVRASAQALPLASGAASGVTIGGSLNEIGDVDTCLGEARRLLADGGRLVMMSLARAATPLGGEVQRLLGPAGIAFWTPEELTALLARHGLATLRREQYGIVLFTLAVPASGAARHGEAVHAD